MRPEKTVTQKIRKRVLATALLALAGFALSGCAPAKPLTFQESTDKVVSDLQQFSRAIAAFTAKKGVPPRSGGVKEDFGKDLRKADLLPTRPKPPKEIMRADFNPELYRYEYSAEFDEIGGPTAEGNDSALVLHGITAEACRRINYQATAIGDRVPSHKKEGYLRNVSFYCTDFGGATGYSVIKYQTLR